MKTITAINVTEDVALVTLSKVPATVDFISRIFDALDEQGVIVDMISQTALTGEYVSISFTADSEDIGKIPADQPEKPLYPAPCQQRQRKNFPLRRGDAQPLRRGGGGVPGAQGMPGGYFDDYHFRHRHFAAFGQRVQRAVHRRPEKGLRFVKKM